MTPTPFWAPASGAADAGPASKFMIPMTIAAAMATNARLAAGRT